MVDNLINLLLLAVLGVIYMFSFSKSQQHFFDKILKPKNEAVTILYLASIASAAIHLFHVSDATSDAVLFFLDKDDMIRACIYSLGFFGIVWLFSNLFFRFSFFVTANLTKENEMDELVKNNREIAWLHALILISLTFAVAPALEKMAVSMIPYPELPF